MAQIIPLHRIARSMNDARAIGAPEDEWRRLHNEVRFYRSDRAHMQAEAAREFRHGLKVGLWIGCVVGMWVSVLLAWIWVLAR